MTKPQNFLVNDLLTISRLADHFHAMVTGFEGREALYSNPGIALRSYVVSNCLRKHIQMISEPHLLESISECIEFQRDENKILIMEMLVQMAADLSYEISTLPTNLHVKFYTDNNAMLMDLNSQMLSVKEMLDNKLLNGDQKMFDLKELIDMLTYELSMVPTQPTKGAA